MLGNVKPLPKKGRGVKEALAVVLIAGNMGNKIETTGSRKKEDVTTCNLVGGI